MKLLILELFSQKWISVINWSYKVSLIVLGETQRNKFNGEPALSFVPEALAPPNGCCPTTAPGFIDIEVTSSIL
jgi:hypothetical protein